jgi:DNA repair photolyase
MIARVVPGMTQFQYTKKKVERVQEKGRKKNYSQFNLRDGEWKKQERLLNNEEINSFLEISVRAAACPMPFNIDVWDSLNCPFSCIYCFADAFRASLYTAFFDNSKTMGMRHANPITYKQEMDKMDKYRVMSMSEKRNLQGINKAFALQIPVRMGIRFEDFLKNERKEKISWELLKYLKDIEYPVMINTKSALPSEDGYINLLADNPAGAAIHITLISSDNEVLKKLEPGAPSYDDRLKALKDLCDSGIRVVARIEPFLFLLTDEKEAVEKYINDVYAAGVRNITFDTYSYTANNPGIRQSFMNKGFDFDRIFIAGCDSQPLGSLLLSKFMELFREKGFSCSSFDMGNVPTNNDAICCEITGAFPSAGYNYGSTVFAARFIKKRSPKYTTWDDFERYVDKKGGFLTPDLRMDVKKLWNLEGNLAYSHKWASGLKPVGRDENGIIWVMDESDYRVDILNTIL